MISGGSAYDHTPQEPNSESQSRCVPPSDEVGGLHACGRHRLEGRGDKRGQGSLRLGSVGPSQTDTSDGNRLGAGCSPGSLSARGFQQGRWPEGRGMTRRPHQPGALKVWTEETSAHLGGHFSVQGIHPASCPATV